MSSSPATAFSFRAGRLGVQQLTNDSAERVWLLLVLNFAMRRAAVQLDSGKMMIRWGTGTDESRWFRVDDAADYWADEPEP